MCHAHSRVVVFHTQHIGQRDTRLFPLISYRSLIFTLYCCSVPRLLFYFLLSIFSPVPSRRLRWFFPRPRQVNSLLFPPPHPYSRPRSPFISLTQVYQWLRRDVLCDRVLPPPDVFLHCQEPRLLLAVATEVYLHFLYRILRGIRPVSRLTNWVWNPPRALPMHGVTTQVSDPKRSTVCTTDLKNNPDTRGAAPLSAEDAQHPPPKIPCPGQVLHHRRPLVVLRRDHQPQVFWPMIKSIYLYAHRYN